MKYLNIFNIFAIIALVVDLLLQGYMLGYYLTEVDNQNRSEALFGIAMFAVMSLWVVAPALVTGSLTRGSYAKTSHFLLILCVVQLMIILIMWLI
ncbi:hypothetical protein ABT56_12400 [Photobacterium aquae]|uniref:Uncharacterized protein n=1 Tax=Photobacterium aquae TaxID=1195763 RepID=A0A0J1H048_9GAMM|nr:hypothetical protein [Photobacterium aquae]KLV05179.1 hypothetical protein ABT56_12400 [Photobacterium aquae]